MFQDSITTAMNVFNEKDAFQKTAEKLMQIAIRNFKSELRLTLLLLLTFTHRLV
jgi:hypothetical protein